MGILNSCGFREGIDYIHQFACAQETEGLIAVADFCFPEEKIIIELDGSNHKYKSQREKDEIRDKTFLANDYSIFRIKTPLSEYEKILWKYIIQQTVDEKRNGSTSETTQN